MSIPLLKRFLISFGKSSNGRTAAFEAVYHGSNPCFPAIKTRPTFLAGLVFIFQERHGFQRGGEGGEAPPCFGGVLRGGNPSKSELASGFE